MGKQRSADSHLAVEFIDDARHPPVAPAPRSSAFIRVLLFAVVLCVGAITITAGRQVAVSGHPIAAPPSRPVSKPTPLNDGYLTSWHYGTPSIRVYQATGSHYLAAARGPGSEILIVSIGSRGCPTLVTSIAVYSTTEFAITEDQLAGFSGCFLGTSAITNVLLVPNADLTQPITIELGTTSVVLPPS